VSIVAIAFSRAKLAKEQGREKAIAVKLRDLAA
jgi:hypothetical protein